MAYVDTRLEESLNNNISIDNSFGENADNVRIKLFNSLRGAEKILGCYVKDYKFPDDVYPIIKNINVKKNDAEPVFYDRKTNLLSYSYSGEEKDMADYYELKSMLDIVTQRYFDNKKCSGFIRTDEQGNEHWNGINRVIRDKMILYVTGMKENVDESENLYELSDREQEMALAEEDYMELEKVIGLDKIVDTYVYAKGDDLYNELMQGKKEEQKSSQTL